MERVTSVHLGAWVVKRCWFTSFEYRMIPALQIGWSLQYLEYNWNHLLGVILIKCILLNVLRLMQGPTLYHDLQKLKLFTDFKATQRKTSAHKVFWQKCIYSGGCTGKVTEKCFDLNTNSFYQMLQDNSVTLTWQVCKILFLTKREKKKNPTTISSK